MNTIWKSMVDEKYEVYVEQGEPYNGELVIKEVVKEFDGHKVILYTK